MKHKIYIYLADKTRLLREGNYLPPQLAHIYYPENGKNEQEMQEFITNLVVSGNSVAIVTDSLFFIREVYMSRIPVIWFNFNFETGTVVDSESVDDIGSIAVLDRDLKQSERYMNFELGLKS